MGNSDNSKSIYKRGADDGLIFGLYLSLMFIAMAVSLTDGSLPAGLTGFAMTVAVPVVIYFFLRKSYMADGRTAGFSALWLQGICIFFFGSLLMALTAYVYMRIIHPAFIAEVLETARVTYDSLGTAEGDSMARMIEQIQTGRLAPTAGQMAMEIIWLAVFTGSVLSMLVTLIVRAVHGRPTPMN